MKRQAPRAGDIMSDDPVVLTSDQLVRDCAELMCNKQAPVAVLVDDERRPLGVVSEQGLMLALLDIANHGMPPGPLRQYLDPGLETVEESVGLLHLAERFVRKGYSVRGLAVVREGRLVGVVQRRLVVQAVIDYLKGVDDPNKRVLYLSALREMDETPYFE